MKTEKNEVFLAKKITYTFALLFLENNLHFIENIASKIIIF